MNSHSTAFAKAGLFAIAVILCGLIAQFLIFSMVKLPAVGGSQMQTPVPFVKLAGAGAENKDELLTEHSLLYDSEPLFFPTGFNTANAGNGPALPGSTSPFSNYPERLTISATILDPSALLELQPVENIRSMLNPRFVQPFKQYLAAGRPVVKAAHAEGLVTFTVTSFVDDGMRQGTLPDSIVPEKLKGELWSPAQFGLISRSGSILGVPFLVQSSGFEPIDTALVKALESPGFCAVLEDGYHVVTFAP